jgi:hypothetical protein
MSMTLVEATKYSNDILQKGVVELLVKDDPILEKLPFKDIKGNGLTYNQETTLSGADFYNVNDDWKESTSVVTSVTATTTILGGDADVDNFLKATRSNEQDLMQEQIAAKTKAIKRKFLDAFFYGYVTGGSDFQWNIPAPELGAGRGRGRPYKRGHTRPPSNVQAAQKED